MVETRPFGLGLWGHPAKIRQAVELKASLWASPTGPAGGRSKPRGTTIRSGRSVVTDGRRTRELACDFLACGFGLIPNLELPALLGCGLNPDSVQVDRWGETTVPRRLLGRRTDRDRRPGTGPAGRRSRRPCRVGAAGSRRPTDPGPRPRPALRPGPGTRLCPPAVNSGDSPRPTRSSAAARTSPPGRSRRGRRGSTPNCKPGAGWAMPGANLRWRDPLPLRLEQRDRPPADLPRRR